MGESGWFISLPCHSSHKTTQQSPLELVERDEEIKKEGEGKRENVTI